MASVFLLTALGLVLFLPQVPVGGFVNGGTMGGCMPIRPRKLTAGGPQNDGPAGKGNSL